VNVLSLTGAAPSPSSSAIPIAAMLFGMRVVLQRVSRASVGIAGTVVGRVGQGFCLLVGFTHTDTAEQVQWMADKIAGLRVFGDAEGKMNRSLADVGGGVLVVSQFTLYGDTAKGRRPSFVDAARPDLAIPLYERFVSELRNLGIPVETGEFGAMMEVEILNDGPVTLVLERSA
jgi:D-tyrosyl-tRNA(Tyr) deacylase